jgi:DnaJ-domain-containing protein 1
MIDYFSLLQQPRRPWLNAEQLKEKYIQLTISMHPDRQTPQLPEQNPAPDFANINNAFRVLVDPKARLQHLLKLEGIATSADSVPETLADVFLETGTLIQEIDLLISRTTANTLSKALRQPEILEARKLAADLLDKLQAIYHSALEELQKLDQLWTSTHRIALELSAVSAKLAYLTRWIAQLEERQFQLSIL